MTDNLNIKATSLDDLADVVVDVPVERPDGRVVIVPLKALSEGAVWLRRQQVSWPSPPPKDINKVAGALVTTYDYQDATFLAAQRAANRKLTYLLLLDSLPFEVPGATDDEKIDTVQARLGQFAFLQLVDASNRLNTVTEEAIANMARSFRANGKTGAAGSAGLGTDPQPVADAQPA